MDQLNPGAKALIVPVFPVGSEALNAKICDLVF